MFTHRSCIRWVYLFCKLYRLLLGSTRNFRVKVIGRHGVWPVCLPKRVIKYCNYAEICCFSHLPIVRGTWVYISLYIYIYTLLVHLYPTWIKVTDPAGPLPVLCAWQAWQAWQMEMKRQSVFRMASGVDDGFFWPVDDFQRYHQHWYIHAPPWMTIPQLGPSINVAEWL